MRQTVIDYLNANLVTGFKVSSELPFDQGDTPLYLKNSKVLYTEQTQTTQEPLFETLDGGGAVLEVTTIPVYVSTDAKTLPSTYDELVTAVKGFRLTLVGPTQRLTLKSTEYVGDKLVTRFDISYTTLICN